MAGTDNIFPISVNFIKDLILLLVLQFSDIHDYTTLHYITWPDYTKTVKIINNDL